LYNKKIFLAGHNGLAGSAILRLLQKDNYKNLELRAKEKLDLLRQNEVENYFKEIEPEIVILAAGKVGVLVQI